MTRIMRSQKRCHSLGLMSRLFFVLVLASVMATVYLTATTLRFDATSLEQRSDPKQFRNSQAHKNLKETAMVTNGHQAVKSSSTKVNYWKKDSPLAGDYLFSNKDSSSPFCKDTCRLYFPVDQDDSTNNRHSTRAPPHSHIVTRKGMKGLTPNQDRSFLLLQEESQWNQKQKATSSFVMAALFDGHGEGGHDSAEIAIRGLPFALMDKIRDDIDDVENLERLFREAFLEVDKGPIMSIPQAGTTAVVALKIGNRLFLASAGDSIGMVVRYFPKTLQAEVVASAVKHKPANPGERERIEAAGGLVIIPPGDFSSRAVYTTAEGNEMALAMSRSLGDRDGKGPGYLIAEPSVVVVDESSLGTHDEASFLFLVVASDGVFDMVSLEVVTKTLGKALADEKDQNALAKACNDLMGQAARTWAFKMFGSYRDDMTLVVSRLNG